MKTVAFTTLGCRVNQYDTDAMKGLFLQNNYEAVDFDEKADIYVINTCSVTNMGEKKSRQLIRKAKRQNEIKTRLKWKQTVIYQGDHIPFLCVRNSRIFTAALGKELYYVRNYWIYRAS